MRLFLLILVCICLFPALAQESDEDTPEDRIVYGEVVSGQINNTTTYQTYTFEAMRCDFLRIRVRTTNGNLDVILSVFDEDNTLVFSRDDSSGSTDVDFEPLSIPTSGVYTIVVGRFGYRLGTTSGSYELLVERIGNGSASGCAIRYGDTVTNTLNDVTPEAWYRFSAERGDMVNLHMRATGGNLDPVLTVVDGGGFALQTNDDASEGVIDAAITALLIPADGSYFVRASRYGNTHGNFVLTLQEAANSGMGNSPLAAIPLRPNSTIEGTLSAENPAQYYRFEARQNEVISVNMQRLSNNLDSLLLITDIDGNELFEDDDGGEGQNSRITEFLIPADGTYFLVATRFEREEGRTTGRYQLRFESEGNAFAEVPPNVLRLTSPITVSGSIDDVTPEVRYAFGGIEDERVTIAVNRTSGDLDPMLRLLDGEETPILTDNNSGRNQNALINGYRLPATGVYYIVVSSFNSEATGGFTLSFEIERLSTPTESAADNN
jgi:hypothetical protein